MLYMVLLLLLIITFYIFFYKKEEWGQFKNGSVSFLNRYLYTGAIISFYIWMSLGYKGFGLVALYCTIAIIVCISIRKSKKILLSIMLLFLAIIGSNYSENTYLQDFISEKEIYKCPHFGECVKFSVYISDNNEEEIDIEIGEVVNFNNDWFFLFSIQSFDLVFENGNRESFKAVKFLGLWIEI